MSPIYWVGSPKFTAGHPAPLIALVHHRMVGTLRSTDAAFTSSDGREASTTFGVGYGCGRAGHPVVRDASAVPDGVQTYPIAQHVAEKLHALSFPRDVENTRARDLVDLARFAQLVDPVRGLSSLKPPPP